MENQKLRGAIPSSNHKLCGAEPYRIRDVIPAQVAYVPAKLSYWLNNQYGDCVTAEEAFNKAASGIFIEDSTVLTFCRQHNLLNGAMLPDVMDLMARSGFSQGGHLYGDGGYKSVDYSNEPLLKSALSIAPVKIGIDANALPQSAGTMGFHAFGGREGQFRNTDHCISIAGFGPAAFLFGKLNIAVPAGVDPAKLCYMIFTWNSLGVVDHDWIMSTVSEAWLRNPSTLVDGTPQPNPGPPPAPPVPPTPPTPPVPPTPPTPAPSGGISLIWLGVVGFMAVVLTLFAVSFFK